MKQYPKKSVRCFGERQSGSRLGSLALLAGKPWRFAHPCSDSVAAIAYLCFSICLIARCIGIQISVVGFGVIMDEAQFGGPLRLRCSYVSTLDQNKQYW